MQRPMQRLCVRYSLALMLIFQLAVLSAPQARAFEVRAHIAACELAWQLAQPQTRQWLKDTLRDSPFKRFNAACPWPDKARDESRFKDTGPWHYVNVDENAVKVSEQDCSRKGCVLTAIEAMKQRLLQASSPSPSTLTSTPTPTSAQTGAEISGLNRQYRTDELEPWQALLFFSHFVTDLHQPLHVSYADDRGGNRAKIKFNGEWTNLHRLWDGELLGMYSVSQLINDWQQHPVSDDRLQGTTAEWQQNLCCSHGGFISTINSAKTSSKKKSATSIRLCLHLRWNSVCSWRAAALQPNWMQLRHRSQPVHRQIEPLPASGFSDIQVHRI